MTTTPSSTLRFGLPIAVELVDADGACIGHIETRPDGEVWLRPIGWPYFVPARFGLRMHALADLERFAALPSGWRPNPANWQRSTRPIEGKAEDGGEG